MIEKSLLSTPEAAALMGKSRWWLLRQSQRNLRLRACIVDQTTRNLEWSVQRLRELGFLLQPSTPAAPAPVLSYSAAFRVEAL